MAMFSSSGGDDRSRAKRSVIGDAELSILAKGMRVKGELETKGVVKIEGHVEGSIRADGQVLVAKGGRVDGDIYSRQAVIGGEVHGAIYADERVEVQSSSLVVGDVTTPKIIVQEGGRINGSVKMANPKALSGQPKNRDSREPEKTRPGQDRPSSGSSTIHELQRTG